MIKARKCSTCAFFLKGCTPATAREAGDASGLVFIVAIVDSASATPTGKPLQPALI